MSNKRIEDNQINNEVIQSDDLFNNKESKKDYLRTSFLFNKN
jgi:hypothetical protein